MVTDPIADMLTRIRNAITARHPEVNVALSKEKLAIAKIMEEEGYISAINIVENDKKFKEMNIVLKYLPNGENVIQGLKRISKPGLRVYAKGDNLPRVLNGLGVAIISTSKGLMADRDARKANLGGEVVAYVW